jgi:hypothetical protein
VPDNNSSHATHEGVRRRSVVRVGATAAWAVPVVAMAAPASAAACSGGSTTLTAVTIGDPQQSGCHKPTVTQQVQVCNTGASATCDLSATVTSAGASRKLNLFSVSGWPAATVGHGGSRSLTVTAPADQQLQPGECATYTVTYKLHDAARHHTTTVHFFTSNGATASVSVTTAR